MWNKSTLREHQNYCNAMGITWRGLASSDDVRYHVTAMNITWRRCHHVMVSRDGDGYYVTAMGFKWFRWVSCDGDGYHVTAIIQRGDWYYVTAIGIKWRECVSRDGDSITWCQWVSCDYLKGLIVVTHNSEESRILYSWKLLWCWHHGKLIKY